VAAAIGVAFAVWMVPTRAAASAAPDATTGVPSNVVQTGATLNATVNPNGATVTDCHFDWGTTLNFGHSVPCVQSPGSGTTNVAVWAAITGLSPNTVYYYRVEATNAAGTTDGDAQPFATPPDPIAGTCGATQISTTTATFTGNVEPRGTLTTAHFEYGLDPKDKPGGGALVYDMRTPEQTVGSDTSLHTIQAKVAGLRPNSQYHVRIVITWQNGTTTGQAAAFTTFKDGARGASNPPPGSVPPPVLGKTETVQVVSGQVYVRLPGGPAADTMSGAALLHKGVGFVALKQPRSIPMGSQIDARTGTLTLAAASATRGGKPQLATLGGAIFSTRQSTRGITKGLTTLTLLEGDFPGAPSYAQCARPAADAPAADDRAHAARSKPKRNSKVLQTLRAQDNHGKYSTQGQYSSATVRGTIWTVSDRCDGTLTTVRRGTVLVYDKIKRKTITLHAGHKYLARAPFRRRRG
jgi:hypothetical protein